ncbi:H-type lectin domain-containing protein [Archangium sp.]|jgi:hypothetical protein|uniref:H-type lectin domain-containing protein n=1 Tax=Archangium sp. TaxID=1872627 RepID=UPI002ED85CAC
MPSKLPLLTTCALLSLPVVAQAESNPRALSIRVQCPLDNVRLGPEAAAVRDCRALSGWFEGRLDWRSGGRVGDETSGTLLFSEFGRFYATRGLDGEILIYVDGNNIPEDFAQRYLTPGPDNVLTSPDLRILLYLRKGADYERLTDQRFMPVASAAWARYAEESLRFTGELSGDVVGPQDATRVVAIQDVPVAVTPLTPGQELRFDGLQWLPTSPSPLLAGAGLQGGSYDGQLPATFSVVFGTGPGTVTEGSDARLPPAPGTAGQLLYSNGSSWSALSPGAPAQVLHGGATPTWGPVVLDSEVGGVLPAANGGTGLSAPGWAGNFLRSTGTGWTSGPLTGADVPAGSGHYIQNQGGVAQNARMWITGQASVGGLQVGEGTSFQKLQMGTLWLNPPSKCTGYPVIKCNYVYSLWFPKAFSSPPTVVVTPRSSCSNCADMFTTTTRNVTQTGFQLVITRSDANHDGESWGQFLQIDYLAGN